MPEVSFGAAETGPEMREPDIGGLTGWTEVVALECEGGASEALSVTRTVSRLRGTLMVLCERFPVSGLVETAPDFRGGSTAPVCLETGTLDVCRGCGRCDVVWRGGVD